MKQNDDDDEEEGGVDGNDNGEDGITGDEDTLVSAYHRRNTTSKQEDVASKEDAAPAVVKSAAADDRTSGGAHYPQHRFINATDFVSRKEGAPKHRNGSANNHSSRERDVSTDEAQQGEDVFPAATADVGEEESISPISQASCAASQNSEDDDDDYGGKDKNHNNKHQDDAEWHTHEEADENANNFVPPLEGDEYPQLHAAATTFPQHLMDVIEQESQQDNNNGNPCILEWVEGGDAFLIRDKVALERTILPKYFSKNCKCKFISFVRKLYRWGFRQGVASPRGTSMTFMHPNFIRGDKQRCNLMRSIVKKPVSTPLQGHQASAKHEMAARHLLMQPQPQMGRGVVEVPTVHRCYYPTNSNTQHAFGSSVLLRLGQQQVVSSLPSRLAQQDVPIVPLSLSVLQNLAYHGIDQFPAAVASSAHVVHETTNASSSSSSSSRSSMQHHSEILERILFQHRQEELVRHIFDRINDGTTADSRLPLPPAAAAPALPPYNQPSMMPTGQQPATLLGSLVAGASFGQHHYADFGRLTTTGNIMNVVVAMEMPAVVVLASQIMKINPGIEPWRALELAKKCLPGHDK